VFVQGRNEFFLAACPFIIALSVPTSTGTPILRHCYVPEKVGVNKKGVNKKGTHIME
jgi:hypothetical protein